MSDQDPTRDPIPGWPEAPDPDASGSTPPPGPPAGGYPPPSYPPPSGTAPPSGYAAPSGYAPPSGFAPPPASAPNTAPPPGYGYGYAGYGYPVVRDHPQGTTILVLGILSLVVCGLLGPVAWIMGNNAIKEIDANPSAYGNRGNVQAGRICGIIATCLLVLIVGAYAVLAIVVFAGSSTS